MPRPLLTIAAALALADASIVTLALPPIIAELDGSVETAAAVLGVYTLVLALGLAAADRLRGRLGSVRLATAGLALFAAASLACGLAGSIGFLIAMRAVQAVGAAALLVCAFDLLDAAGSGRRVWLAVAVFGAAVGPALGGLLTELFEWRSIFLFQAPVVAFAAFGVHRIAPPRRSAPVARDPERASARTMAGLALVSAALTGVLFLLVLLLVTGWSLSPLAAAAAVSILPVAAFAGALLPGDAATRAAAGAALLAGGVAMLAWVPTASVGWTVVPQIVGGLGMGMALTALTGELIPERSPAEAARLFAVRHAGITIALAILAPIAAAQLDQAVEDSRERGAALVLDAKLSPVDKFDLVDTVLVDVDPVDPRGQLQEALRSGGDFADDEDERAAYGTFERRTDETIVAGVREAFAPGLLVCGGLAALAALALLPAGGPGRRTALITGAAAAALVLGAAVTRPAIAPEPVKIADPCQDRDLPGTGGITGFAQDAALVALDRAACRWGSSREELALALADDAAARDFQRDHDVDPREFGGLLKAVAGL